MVMEAENGMGDLCHGRGMWKSIVGEIGWRVVGVNGEGEK